MQIPHIIFIGIKKIETVGGGKVEHACFSPLNEF